MVWLTTQWSDEFRIEFDIKISLDIQNSPKSDINAITLEGFSTASKRGKFGVWAVKGNFFKICYPEVNGNTNYCQNYNFKMIPKMTHNPFASLELASLYFRIG